MNALPEPATAPAYPNDRQVLVNIGNRYVVFGTQIAFAGRPLLGPDDVKTRFADRVGDEADFPPERLVQSIQVRDAETVLGISEDTFADIELIFNNNARLLVDIKVNSRDLKSKELSIYWERLREQNDIDGRFHEIWNFNIDRMKLTMLWVERTGIPAFCDLDPLDVWEFNSDGSVFDRAQLVERIEDWVGRIEGVYARVEEWASHLGLRAERARTILMSEELMQNFAIPDRELAILDLSRVDAPVMSVVPVGLWVLGSNGRIDILTREGSAILLDTAQPLEPPNWVYFLRGSERVFKPWNEAAFRELVSTDASA
jgi:hypothetical protein